MNKEVYERIIDLAEKVYKGEVNPLDVDIDRFIGMLKQINVEALAEDLMYLDIRALYGLTLILESQSEVIKRKTQGMFLDSFMIRLRLMNLNINQLANLIENAWFPPVELSAIDENDIIEAKLYFESIVKYVWSPPKVSDYKVEYKEYFSEEELSSMINNLYSELITYSDYKWVDYIKFISLGDMLFRAYLLSFLISEGYVEMKINRMSNEIYIRPLKSRKTYRNPASLPVVLKSEKR